MSHRAKLEEKRKKEEEKRLREEEKVDILLEPPYSGLFETSILRSGPRIVTNRVFAYCCPVFPKSWDVHCLHRDCHVCTYVPVACHHAVLSHAC